MAGLILLVALIAFLTLVIWLSGLLTQWLPLSSNGKALLRVVIVVGVFPLMLVDEIIGKHQFEALCKANGIESADVSKARGRQVRLEVGERHPLESKVMPGAVENWSYKDADTGEVLIHHKSFYAYGGWIMRYTPLSMGSRHPMLFQGGCNIDYSARNIIFSKNDISLIN